MPISFAESLAYVRPELAKEWHPYKNGLRLPTQVGPRSSYSYWWRCERRHEWRASAYSRSAAGTGCPVCSGRRVGPRGENSVAVVARALARQWHPTKNVRSAREVHAGAPRRHWWKCSKGPDHEWLESPAQRRSKGLGCPFCSGRRVSSTNALSKVDRKLAAEWHPTKNGKLTPRQLTAGSAKRVWWRCSVDRSHEWCASPALRRGCPFCAGRYTARADSLLMLHPRLAKEWHPTRNGKLRADQVRPGSEREVWWKCSGGPDHEWYCSVKWRVRRGFGCPFCANRRLSVTNSLLALHPKLAREWHEKRNGRLRPGDVRPTELRRVWWKCPKGLEHVWQATIRNRAYSGTGCPYCSGRRPSAASSLAGRHPRIAAQWHPKLNGSRQPTEVPCHSKDSVWWRCHRGHAWQAQIKTRAYGNGGCPVCWATRGSTAA
jgi:hypothetical protein